jgi:4'-phosphopantetheinyl transferase
MREVPLIQISCLNVEDVSPAEFQTISAEVSKWTKFPESIINERVLQKHILGKWLTFSMLKMYGIPADLLKKMALTSYGKPFISADGPFFNIAHSNNLIVGAISPTSEVGIDIEYLRPVDWIEYENCFSIEEWRSIAFTDDPNRKLLEAWTKKESLVKADGRGLQITLTDVFLDDAIGSIAGEGKQWHIRPVDIPGYIAHVCSDSPNMEIEIVSNGSFPTAKKQRETSW